MRVRYIATITICLLLLGCSKKTAELSPAAEKPTSQPAASAEATDEKAAPNPLNEKKAKENPSKEKLAQPTSGVDGATGGTPPSAISASAASGETPKVSEAECQKACSHAGKLSMASLPSDATAEMKTAIAKALADECPKNCVAKGTPAMVKCILAARSGMDLAACPK